MNMSDGLKVLPLVCSNEATRVAAILSLYVCIRPSSRGGFEHIPNSGASEFVTSNDVIRSPSIVSSMVKVEHSFDLHKSIGSADAWREGEAVLQLSSGHIFCK